MNESCLFCGIVAKKIPAKITFEDEWTLAFPDIRPQAPCHELIIPKQHVPHAHACELDTPEHQQMLLACFRTLQHVATLLGVNESGYRIVNNCKDQGGQTVHHLHFHLLGKRHMTWPPG